MRASARVLVYVDSRLKCKRINLLVIVQNLYGQVFGYEMNVNIIVTSIKNNVIKLKDEVGMAVPKKT